MEVNNALRCAMMPSSIPRPSPPRGKRGDSLAISGGATAFTGGDVALTGGDGTFNTGGGAALVTGIGFLAEEGTGGLLRLC